MSKFNLNKVKRASAIAMATMLTASLAVPAFAAQDAAGHDSVIHMDRTASVTLYKIIQNDGANTQGTGHENPAITALLNGNLNDNTAGASLDGKGLDGIEFSYFKIADWVSEDGNQNPGGASATGRYWTDLDAGFKQIATDLNITIAETKFNHETPVIEGSAEDLADHVQDGIQTVTSTVYSNEAMMNALEAILAHPGDGSTYTGETKLHDYVKTNGTAMAKTADGSNQSIAKGKTSVSELPLGLYLFGETDITAHDGIDPATNAPYVIDPNEVFTAQQLSAFNQLTDTEQADVLLKKNPEFPIVESPAKPFLVSLPMTNVERVTDTDGTVHNPGTVWEYDLTIYPKDQTSNVIKRIIDPDETESEATYRVTEDYEIGETIKQVIIADAPTLQKSYEYDINDANIIETVQPATTHKTYKIKDTMTEGYHFKPYSENTTVVVMLGNKVQQVPQNNAYFTENAYNASTKPGGFKTLRECNYNANGSAQENTGDYYVLGIKDASSSNNMNTTSTNKKVADGDHGFEVVFTQSGLTELDNRTADSQVAVFFNADMDKIAKIGTDASYTKKGNMNMPTLTWRNSNTLEKSIEGNRVYTYTYELDVKKIGLTHPENAKFTVTRKADGSAVRFVQEDAGVYHIYDAQGMDAGLAASSVVTEISPATGDKTNGGMLKIKGFDSKTYTFQEVETQSGASLLKSTFDVAFNEEATVRDGELTNAVLTVDNLNDDLDINKDPSNGGNGGLVKVTVDNPPEIALRTGGEGRTVTMIVFGAGAAVLLCGFVFYKKKQQKKETV